MKKFIKHIVCGLTVFVIINAVIAYIYENPGYKAIKNKTHKNYLKWNSIHTKKNTYDLIILGSSRAFNAFNPKIIDSGLQLKSFNVATSAQDIAESYYSFKEILDYQRPKYIVLETYLNLGDDSHDFYQIFSNASFFLSSENKYQLIVDGYGEKGILNYCIPILKFNNYIKQDIIRLISRGKQKIPERDWREGYLYNTSVLTDKKIKNFKPIPNFDNTGFNELRFNKYFKMIEKLASLNDVKLIVLRSPYPPSRLSIDSNKDEENFYRDYMHNFENVVYFDLNLYKKEQFKYSDIDFSDYHHTNIKGAKKASLQLVDIINHNDL